MKRTVFSLLVIIIFSVLILNCDNSTTIDSILDEADRATFIKFIDEDEQPGEIAGHIVIGRADNESGIDNYLVYWGSSQDEPIGDPFLDLPKNGSDLIYFLDDNTIIPTGAEYFLAGTRTMDGSLTDPVYIEIADNNDHGIYTIYDIQDISSSNHPAEEKYVLVKNVIITAIRDNDSFWIQEPEITGHEYAGIYVYNPNIDISSLSVGNTVTVDGQYKEFYGLSEISLTELTIVDSGNTSITPVLVNPGDVATGGTDAEKYEGVLVEIQSITVTDDTPDDPDTGEFIVTGGLRIDDEIFLIDPDPVLDDSFISICGILTYSYTSVISGSNSKLLPRGLSDVQ